MLYLMIFLILLRVKWKLSSKNQQIEYSKHFKKRIKNIEQSINTNYKTEENKDSLHVSDSESNEEGPTVKYIKNKQRQKPETVNTITSSINAAGKPTTFINATTSRPPRKQKEARKLTKRAAPPIVY